MHVTIHEEKCIGAGQCVLAAPRVFDQREDDGVVILLDENPAEAERGEVDEAAALCPAAVIEVGR
jgi:ferredoxin